MPNAYRLKIILNGVTPPIYWRVEVDGTMRLNDLCVFLLSVMGWSGGHMFSFTTLGETSFPAGWAREFGGRSMGPKKVQDCLRFVKQK